MRTTLGVVLVVVLVLSAEAEEVSTDRDLLEDMARDTTDYDQVRIAGKFLLMARVAEERLFSARP